MRVVVGLGNPGRRYAGTHHNVGFATIDNLANSPHAGRFQQRFEAEIAELNEGTLKILLVKPQTFMNLSGRAVRPLVDFYQLELSDLLVVCDDFNLPLGQLRVRALGTHGGHNGLRDIQAHLGTTEYARLRIGVGAPDRGDVADYVLDRFSKAEQATIDDSVLHAAQAVMVWAERGIEVCMNQFNAKKSKDA